MVIIGRHAGGAAIYLDNVFANFTQVDFLDNVASAPGTGGSYAKGGAIHAFANYSSFKRCRFEGNQTITGNGSNDDEGGAFFGRQSTRPSFFYCDFAENAAHPVQQPVELAADSGWVEIGVEFPLEEFVSARASRDR